MPTTSIASADSRQMMKRALPMIAAGDGAKVGGAESQARMVTRIVLILKAAGNNPAGGARQRRSQKSPHAAGFLGKGYRLFEVAGGQGCLVGHRNIAGLGRADGLLCRGG